MARTTDPVEILQQVLRDHDVSQAAFADEAGIAPATINRWLNRRTRLTERKLAEALLEVGISPEVYGLKVPGLPGRAARDSDDEGDRGMPAMGAGEYAAVIAQVAAAEERARIRHEEQMVLLRSIAKHVGSPLGA